MHLKVDSIYSFLISNEACAEFELFEFRFAYMKPSPTDYASLRCIFDYFSFNYLKDDNLDSLPQTQCMRLL